LQVRILPGEPVLDCHPQFGKPANHGWRAAREGADSRLAGDKVYRLSTPVTEELDPVPHGRGGRGCAKMEQAAQLLANREPLLRRQNHAGMLSSGADPFRVKAIEIGHVERVENTPAFGGESQLLVVRLFGKAGAQSREHCDTAGTESRDKIAVHRVFVDVDLDLTHA